MQCGVGSCRPISNARCHIEIAFLWPLTATQYKIDRLSCKRRANSRWCIIEELRAMIDFERFRSKLEISSPVLIENPVAREGHDEMIEFALWVIEHGLRSLDEPLDIGQCHKQIVIAQLYEIIGANPSIDCGHIFLEWSLKSVFRVVCREQ